MSPAYLKFLIIIAIYSLYKIQQQERKNNSGIGNNVHLHTLSESLPIYALKVCRNTGTGYKIYQLAELTLN